MANCERRGREALDSAWRARFGARGRAFDAYGGEDDCPFAVYGPLAAGCGAFVSGLGFGFLNTTFLVAIQSSVSWTQRGVATASNMLMRSIGNALGAAVLGGVLNLTLADYLVRRELSNEVSLDTVRDLISGHSSLPPETLAQLQQGLAGSIHLVFWVIAGFAMLTLLLGWNAPEIDSAAASFPSKPVP